jgi:hypothetical protein
MFYYSMHDLWVFEHVFLLSISGSIELNYKMLNNKQQNDNNRHIITTCIYYIFEKTTITFQKKKKKSLPTYLL